MGGPPNAASRSLSSGLVTVGSGIAPDLLTDSPSFASCSRALALVGNYRRVGTILHPALRTCFRLDRIVASLNSCRSMWGQASANSRCEHAIETRLTSTAWRVSEAVPAQRMRFRRAFPSLEHGRLGCRAAGPHRGESPSWIRVDQLRWVGMHGRRGGSAPMAYRCGRARSRVGPERSSAEQRCTFL